jgi:hypothetical protein
MSVTLLSQASLKTLPWVPNPLTNWPSWSSRYRAMRLPVPPFAPPRGASPATT